MTWPRESQVRWGHEQWLLREDWVQFERGVGSEREDLMFD